MATKNLKLNIHRPGVEGIGDVITFTTVATKLDILRIPRRYPFVDIANYDALKTAGYFRHSTTTVSSDLGGTATTEKEGVLGFQLPNTEKLILLVKRLGVTSSGAVKAGFTIKGSLRNPFDDVAVTWAADADFVAGVRLYEIDLYNFGQYITGITGEDGISIVVDDDVTLEFALIARMG